MCPTYGTIYKSLQNSYFKTVLQTFLIINMCRQVWKVLCLQAYIWLLTKVLMTFGTELQGHCSLTPCSHERVETSAGLRKMQCALLKHSAKWEITHVVGRQYSMSIGTRYTSFSVVNTLQRRLEVPTYYCYTRLIRLYDTRLSSMRLSTVRDE